MEEKSVIILGAGGHGRVLLNALRLSGRNVLGFIDPKIEAGTECVGGKILGGDNALYEFQPSSVELVNGIGSLPGKNSRWLLVARMKKNGYVFSQVVHPSAIISSNVQLEEGVQVMAGCVLQDGVRVGASTIVNTGTIIDHGSEIGENCHLAPGVTISGDVKVGDYTHVGTGATIIHGISVGAHCVVGAGSVIFKDLPSECTYVQDVQIRTKKNER